MSNSIFTTSLGGLIIFDRRQCLSSDMCNQLNTCHWFPHSEWCMKSKHQLLSKKVQLAYKKKGIHTKKFKLTTFIYFIFFKLAGNRVFVQDVFASVVRSRLRKLVFRTFQRLQLNDDMFYVLVGTKLFVKSTETKNECIVLICIVCVHQKTLIYLIPLSHRHGCFHRFQKNYYKHISDSHCRTV